MKDKNIVQNRVSGDSLVDNSVSQYNTVRGRRFFKDQNLIRTEKNEGLNGKMKI